MNYEQDNESGWSADSETVPLILKPLTPEEWERNQAMVDALLAYVMGTKIQLRRNSAMLIYFG